MEQDRRKILLSAIALIVQELIDSSSEIYNICLMRFVQYRHNICLMRGELNFEINEDVEMIDVPDNAENVHDVAHTGTTKRDLICETLRIRHV